MGLPSFVPPPAQPELPGKSRGVQSRWLNHRWRSCLATGAQILQPGRPGRGLDKSILPIRLPLGRQKLEVLFFLQLRLSRQLQRWFPSSRWLRRGRHHRRCHPRRSRALSAHHRRHAGRQLEAGSGGGLEYISPPVDNIADLPRKPASETWQVLPDEMGKINIGLTGRNKPLLVISTCQGELFQQVVIDKTVDNATGHSLLTSLLGDGYRILLPCMINLHVHPWLQISDSSQ